MQKKTTLLFEIYLLVIFNIEIDAVLSSCEVCDVHVLQFMKKFSAVIG